MLPILLYGYEALPPFSEMCIRDRVIPLDETIQAMYKVGLTICPELRCTGLGGLAATPASQALRQKL